MTKEPALREISLDILTEILEKGQYTHVVLAQALSKYQYLDKADRSFIKRVVDGTVEYKIQLDWIINQYSKIKINKMKPVIRTILRMAVYQICYLDRVPDSAACNEAVKLAEKRGFRGLKGFVNGVLRTIAREKETVTFPDDSIRYSMPEWLITLWRDTYGAETCRTMLEDFLKERPLMARYHKSRISKEELFASLESQGVTAVSYGRDGSLLHLSGVDYLEGLQAFRDGYLQVQDLSSALAGDAAGIREGDCILDVCGAPGGKSLHAADLLNGTGSVTVRDISEAKVALIRDNIERSGCRNLSAEVFDALTYDETWEQKADVVLADLPCSGLGIIGRKPDIKYNMTPERLKELARLQREILAVVWRYVKPGGTLVYSTCTINRMENEENRKWFLEQFPFEPEDMSGRLGEMFQEESLEDGYIQFLPGIHPCDGFFIAVMRRKEA